MRTTETQSQGGKRETKELKTRIRIEVIHSSHSSSFFHNPTSSPYSLCVSVPLWYILEGPLLIDDVLVPLGEGDLLALRVEDPDVEG